jgi:protein O-mannosyl-transferase
MLVFLGMVGLTILYWPVKDFGFLRWDDSTYVTARPVMHQLAEGKKDGFRQLLRPQKVLAEGVWQFLPGRDFSYALDAWRGGLSPRIFHQTNFVLHLFAVLMCFLLLRYFMPHGAAIAGALVFGIHPLVVEPVAWISGRKELLYAGLLLGALAALLHARKLVEEKGNARGKSLYLFLFVVLACLSFVCKGPAVILIPMSAMIIWGLDSERRKGFWIAWSVVGVVGLAWLWFLLTQGVAEGILRRWPDGPFGSAFRGLGAPLRAIQSFLLPVDLSPSYGAWQWPWWQDPHSWITGTSVLALLVLWRKKKLPASKYWLLAGLATLAVLPTAGIVSVNQVRADRFAYLFCAFASGLLMAGMIYWLAKRKTAIFALVTIVGVFGFLTKTSLPAWKDDITLWKAVYAKNPDHPVANGSLGAFAMESGQLDLAERLIRKSLKAAPGIAVTWNNLGFLALHRATANPEDPSWIAEAKQAFGRAADLDPKRWLTYFGRAQVELLSKERRAAEISLRRARSLPRGEVKSTIKLANLMRADGRHSEARRIVLESSARLPWDTRLRRWLEKYKPARRP